MMQIAEKAKGLLIKLNAIQPAVSVAGLEEEAAIIKEMKADVILLAVALTPDHPRLEAVVNSCRRDVLASAQVLEKQLVYEHAPGELADGQLHMASLAAEAFVARYQMYASVQESRKALAAIEHANNRIGGIHAAN